MGDCSHASIAGGPAEGASRRLRYVLALTAAFMIVEAVGGWLSGSLALLADAGHMLTDVGALGLTLLTASIARRPADDRKTYGYLRWEILAALVNGAALIGIAAWVVIEAVHRLGQPRAVEGTLLLGVAVAGAMANALALWLLRGAHQHNLNTRGAYLHILGDLLGSVAAVGAGVVILLTGWTPIDPILSVLVALLILRSAWTLIGRSWHVLMEGTPEGLDVDRLRRELTDAVPGVEDVHHVHAWSLTPERPLITFHASLHTDADHDEVLRLLRVELVSRFSIEHSTIQLETNPCATAPCAGKPVSGKKTPQFNVQ